ncbi:MAG: hypothetical protein JW862_15770 [Anaerolineales bacterium]|nr:hypothetical protein [Anaerolineales bacterium]
MSNHRTGYLLIIGWVLLWLLPWGQWLAYKGNGALLVISDILRLALAMMLFLLPGILLFILISPSPGKGLGLSGLIPVGFTLSSFLIGVIGLVGRWAGLSFDTVKHTFALVGLLEILILIDIGKDFSPGWPQLRAGNWKSAFNMPLLAAILLGSLMLFNDNLFFIDDWTYLAYLTNWQQSASLDFNEVIYGVNQIDSARFWLALYPMGQALLAELSGLPGILLLGNYLEYFLVPIAILALYWLAKCLGLSRRAAGFAALAQIAFLCWIVAGEMNSIGMWFFQSLAEDKVTAVHIFAPVLFSFLVRYITQPVLRNNLLVFFAALSIAFTHPIILFFASVILLGLVSISFLFKKLPWRRAVSVAAVVMIAMLPYGLIRAVGHASIAAVPYDASAADETYNIQRFITIRENGLYGAPLHVLQFADFLPDSDPNPFYQLFRSLPLLILFLAGLIGLLKLRKGFVFAYLAVGTLLIGAVVFPYTGWLIGQFVSARLLNRALWFAPLGIGFVVIARTGWDLIRDRLAVQLSKGSGENRFLQGVSARLPLWGFTLLLMMGLASPTTIVVIRSFPVLADYLSFHRQLAQVGDFVSASQSSPVRMVTLNETDDYLPGVSANAKPISFRDRDLTKGHSFNYFFSSQELAEREHARKLVSSLDPGVSLTERREIIEKYEIRYILADPQQVESYLEIMNQDFQLQIVFQSDDFVLLSVNPVNQ